MRICIFSISPKKGGGVITKTMHLIKYFKSLGYIVDWYYPRSKGKLPSYCQGFESEYNVPMKGIFSLPYLRFLDGWDPFREIPDKYDIYQVISGFCTDGMIFRSKHRKFFIWAASTYISEKDISINKEILNLKTLIGSINIFFGKIFEKKYAEKAYKIFSNSLITKNKLNLHLKIDLLKIIPAYPIIDVNKYRFVPHKERDKDDPYILFVGIFSPRKNIPLLLNAFSIASRKHKKIRLKLVGKTNGFLDKYKSCCDNLKIKGKVDFIGEVEDNFQFFANALVTVLPSKEEGFGMVLAESLACGTPVISTKCGGPEEIIKDGKNGILVEEDANALANAIDKVVDNKTLRIIMSENGRKFVEENFSIDSVGPVFVQEYKKLMYKKNRSKISFR